MGVLGNIVGRMDGGDAPPRELLGGRDFLLGVDLGQRQDHTGIVLLERDWRPVGAPYRAPTLAGMFHGMPGAEGLPEWEEVQDGAHAYAVRHIERLPLGTAYTALPGTLRRFIDGTRERVWREHNDFAHRHGGYRRIRREDVRLYLVVDATGVGTAVLDVLRAAELEPLAVQITAGHQVTRAKVGELGVPKKDLAGAALVALEQGRLRIPARLAHAQTLRAELENFRVKVNAAGHETFGAGAAAAWRDGAHDDLVLALALGVWAGDFAGDALEGAAV